jgi:L,D-transpeptidase catalytic domain
MKSVFVVPLLVFLFSVFSSFLSITRSDRDPALAVNYTMEPAQEGISLHPTSFYTSAKMGELVSRTAQLLYDSLRLYEFGLPAEAFQMAMIGYQQVLHNPDLLCIADLSQSSAKKRFYIINVKRPSVLYRTWVAHGRNSGEEYARFFSNRPSSYQSSLGFYLTQGTYFGSNGYSLKLKGLEKGFNDKAEKREIVMHAANYVSEQFIEQNGFLGRSQGCPALSKRDHRKIIDIIKNGSCLFIYHPSQTYLKKSLLLKGDA